MAKQSGLAWTTLTVADAAGTARDIRNDITSLSWKMPRAVQETTGIDKSAIERLLLLADLSYALDGVFNPAATTSSHAVFSTVGTTATNRAVSLVVGGATLGPANCVASSYDLKRSNKGELTWTAALMLADGAVPTWS